jgi:hypothetical protein
MDQNNLSKTVALPGFSVHSKEFPPEDEETAEQEYNGAR